MCLANKDLSSVDEATLKQVYVAIAALLLEAAKLDKDAAAVRCQKLNTLTMRHSDIEGGR